MLILASLCVADFVDRTKFTEADLKSSVTEGDVATLTCFGTGRYNVEWKRDGVAV